MPDSLPYQRHSATSRKAAKAFRKRAPSARFLVYEYIRNHGPCSDKDIQIGLGMNPNTQRPRRVELESAGHIRPSGQDPRNQGRVVYSVTNKPYPKNPPRGYWRSRMRERRAEQPTAEEFGEALRVMAKARKMIRSEFTPGALKVMRWVKKQAKL